MNLKFLIPIPLILGLLILQVPLNSLLADEDPLFIPSKNNKTQLAQPTPPSETLDQNDQPSDVVNEKPDLTPNTKEPSLTPIMTATQTFTPTPTPTVEKSQKTPTPMVKATSKAPPKIQLPGVTTIPNPARGDKVIFRVMTKGPAKARIVVYDRFFSKVKELDGEGDHLFDLIWSLKKVSEGIYHYQTEVIDTSTGESKILSMQSFAVMKDDDTPADP